MRRRLRRGYVPRIRQYTREKEAEKGILSKYRNIKKLGYIIRPRRGGEYSYYYLEQASKCFKYCKIHLWIFSPPTRSKKER